MALITISARREDAYLAIIDNNGVPRFRRRLSEGGGTSFKFHRNGKYPYSYARRTGTTIPSNATGRADLLQNTQSVVLDDQLEEADRVQVVTPLTHTDDHDFVIKNDGNYVLMGYEPADHRDLTDLTCPYGSGSGMPGPCTSDESVEDSVIQEVTPGGSQVFLWNSWDHMAIEDCTQHRFPWDYAHINSLDVADGDIIASFRGCSQILRIDGTSGDVIWRLGKSNRSEEDWVAGDGTPPLTILNDPYGEFCGQHAARMTGNGNLLLFDNGGHCLVDPETGDSTRTSGEFSRVVEYALDVDAGEATFQRHHSLHRAFNRHARSQGHVELLDSGNWLVSWGRGTFDDDPNTPLPPDESITEVNPETGEEVLSITMTYDESDVVLPTRAYPVPSAALADELGRLTATISASASNSGFHTGPSSQPTVVVAFNQPVVDFAADTPSVSVTGGTVVSVAPHLVAGEAAHAYLFTLGPAGNAQLTFRLVTGESCVAGGICTAGNTRLSKVPAAHRIPPPGGGGGGGGDGGGGGGGSRQSRDVHGNSAGAATSIAPTSSTSGEIAPARDRDYFQFDAPYAGILSVETTGSTATMGTVWQNGEELATADSGGAGQNFRLSVRVEAGAVVMAVAGNGRQTGRYTLRVTVLPGNLENPGPDSFQSGIGVISGWVCAADAVELAIGHLGRQFAAYGTDRADTEYTEEGEELCGDTDNGFGLLFNWNLLGEGEHEVVAYVDDIEFSRATVTVTTLGAEFLRGVAGECVVADFPLLGKTVTLAWQQTSQNFVITEGSPPAGATTGGTSALTGVLENPGHNSFQSGVRVLSGWVCDADTVELAIGTAGRQVAAYGTERVDTEPACGDTDNGFGLLFNWNLLGDGEHAVVAYVDDVELGRATVRVTTLGEEFLRGVAGECVVEDFPTVAQTVTLEWQQNSQNFVITDVE